MTEPEFKKPPLIGQLIPYVFAAAILVWVFTGLSSNVVEKVRLVGNQQVELKGKDIKPDSFKVVLPGGPELCDSQVTLDQVQGKPTSLPCPPGGDYGVIGIQDGPIKIFRTDSSRIPDGAEVSVSYVKKVRPTDIYHMLAAADLRLFLPIMAIMCAVFFFADVFSFGRAYKWFCVPDLSLKETMVIRGAPYIIQIGLAPLAEALFPLYLWRVKKVPPAQTVSNTFWVLILDLSAMFTLITPAVIYNVYFNRIIPDIGVTWLVAVGIFWAIFFGNLIFWRTRLSRNAAAWVATGQEKAAGAKGIARVGAELMQLLRTFCIATLGQHFKVYLVRFALILTELAANYAALRAVGADPSLAIALIGVPLVVISIFLPIGVGGYGGPQLIAWLLFCNYGAAGTADQIVAYSILYSTTFLVGRAIIGIIFLKTFWRRAFPAGYGKG